MTAGHRWPCWNVDLNEVDRRGVTLVGGGYPLSLLLDVSSFQFWGMPISGISVNQSFSAGRG